MPNTIWKPFVMGMTLVALFEPVGFGQSRTRALITTSVSNTLEATTRAASPSVVEIFTTSYMANSGVVPSASDLVTTQRASGSGVIVDPDGYIVTNAHVVNGAQRLRVEIPTPVTGKSILAASSRTAPARIVGVDLETDLAVIKVEEQNLASLPFGDSDQLAPGQMVLAFGSPLGLHNSVSLGIVSAVARQLEPESPMIYVQTDASINPGSSGGPLVDLSGSVVGINTLIVTQAGGNEGLGFAAPSNIVRAVYEQIRQFGRVRRGDLGIRAQTLTPLLGAGLKLTTNHGVILADVIPGGPADRAGLWPGDVILKLNGADMENGRQLQVRLYRHAAGETVTFEILRDGRTLNLPVRMTERDEPRAILPALLDPRENLAPRLGILGVSLEPQIARLLPAVRVRSGVVVVSMIAGAIDVRDGGLAPGDIIYAINRTRVSGLAELRTMLDGLKTGDAVVLQLERRGELTYLAFTAD
jgi:serine protease Do